MRKVYIIDAHALLVFLEKEKGYDQVTSVLSTAINNNLSLFDDFSKFWRGHLYCFKRMWG